MAAIARGGSRAKGTAIDASDYGFGLYYDPRQPLDVDRPRRAAAGLVDHPPLMTVTPIGEWGPGIVGGAWLTIRGKKVDLL